MKTKIEEGFAMWYIVVNGVVIQIKEKAEKYELLRSLREEAAS